jgi:hypothetical protein
MLLNNDIGRPRAWRWAKIRRMENLPFNQTKRTRTTANHEANGRCTGGGDEMERNQTDEPPVAPFKARPLEAGSPLRLAARDDRRRRAGPGHTIASICKPSDD